MYKEDEYEEKRDNPFIDGFIYLLKVCFSLGLLYVCGWNIIWDADLYSNKNFLIESSRFAIKFNDLYYGAVIINRFFESVVISWISFSIAFSLISPFRIFFFFSR